MSTNPFDPLLQQPSTDFPDRNVTTGALPQKSVVVQEDKTMDGEKCYTVIDSDEAARDREHKQTVAQASANLDRINKIGDINGGGRKKRRRKTKRKRRRKTKTKRKRRKSKRKTKKQKRRRRRRR